MSRSCGRATAQNFAEFAQNPEMCTPILEMSCIFSIFSFFWHSFIQYVIFLVIFAHFLVKNCKSKVLTAQENQLLEGLVVLGDKNISTGQIMVK